MQQEIGETKLAALLTMLLSMKDAEEMKQLIRLVLTTFGGNGSKPEATPKGKKPYERRRAPMSREERMRALELPRDIAAMARRLSDADFDAYVKTVSRSSTVKRVTRVEPIVARVASRAGQASTRPSWVGQSRSPGRAKY